MTTTTSMVPTRQVRGLELPHSHPAALYLLSLASGSRPTQINALRRIARFFGAPRIGDFAWENISPVQMMALRSWAAETMAPATANRLLSATRSVVKHCAKLRLITRERALEVCDVAPVRGTRTLRGRALEPSEVAKLVRAGLEVADARSLRAVAALGLCYGAGLRRSEAASLTLAEWQGPRVRVLGKGNKQAWVPLPKTARRLLSRWTELRGHSPGALLCRVTKGGRVVPEDAVGGGLVHGWFLELAEVAGVARFTPHDLRRTYVGDLFDLGTDAVTVQEMVRHVDIGQTARYDRRPEKGRISAAERLDSLEWGDVATQLAPSELH